MLNTPAFVRTDSLPSDTTAFAGMVAIWRRFRQFLRPSPEKYRRYSPSVTLRSKNRRLARSANPSIVAGKA